MSADITQFKDAHAGETVIVIGNGPSLSAIPLDFLKSYPTFGSNRIWMLFQPTYYVCTDPLDVEKNYEKICAMTTPKFIRFGWDVGFPLDIMAVRTKTPGWNTFTVDPTKPMYDSCTVTYVALELAYWMGFTTALLVGVDHRYEWNGTRQTEQTSDGNDPNHFIPNYHLPGEIWQPPNLARMEKGYVLAKAAYEKAGRKIINLTEGTALDVFPKDKIENWIK
jgi:hypothetical protein